MNDRLSNIMLWSYNWSYPLTIGRAASRSTSLWLNMHLRTTCADWLHDLRRLMHEPTRSSAIVRSFARPDVRFTATGRQTNRCMRSKFCISPNIHDRLYVLQVDRNRKAKKSYDPVWLKFKRIARISHGAKTWSSCCTYSTPLIIQMVHLGYDIRCVCKFLSLFFKTCVYQLYFSPSET